MCQLLLMIHGVWLVGKLALVGPAPRRIASPEGAIALAFVKVEI